MKILVTGANGFIGKNLISRLKELKDHEVLTYTRSHDENELEKLLKKADFIFHLAGTNRSKNLENFNKDNCNLAVTICEILVKLNKKTPIVYTSSTQAELVNIYGQSKLKAEKILKSFSLNYNFPVYIYRLPNVFGKWAQPNYNSAVATFCYNITHDLPIHINDKNTLLHLVYIDDVISSFIKIIKCDKKNVNFCEVNPVYMCTVGELAEQLYKFKECRQTGVIEAVGSGLQRALYSTYISYLSPSHFSYCLTKHEDSRGLFVEMLKTKDSGQFSFFTAHSGVTRGGHYHHTKTEKFLVLKGKARFRFCNIITNGYYELFTDGSNPEVVETIPGWAHDITNIGEEDIIVMLWANEVFDRSKPDTYVCEV